MKKYENQFAHPESAVGNLPAAQRTTLTSSSEFALSALPLPVNNNNNI